MLNTAKHLLSDAKELQLAIAAGAALPVPVAERMPIAPIARDVLLQLCLRLGWLMKHASNRDSLFHKDCCLDLAAGIDAVESELDK